MSDQLRVGVAGVGHLGYHHARLYASMEGVQFVGVVEPDDQRRERAYEEFGIAGFREPRGLINEGIDAVSVVTPTIAHLETASAFIQAGVHVLVEKPIAPTLHEAQTMVDLAKAHNVVLQVGHVERFNGAVMALFDSIASPRFIECHRLSPFPMRGADVSVVHDLMIHDLDIVLTLEKSDIVSLDAVGVPVFSESEDIANVRLRFASGCVANLTSSRVSLDKMRKIRIFAENAYVSTDYSAQEVLIYRKKPGAIPPGDNPMDYISVEPLDVKKDEPLKLELQSFVNAIKTNTPPAVSGEDGVRALKVVEEIVSFIRAHGGG